MTIGAIAITARLRNAWFRAAPGPATRRDEGQSLVEYALILSVVAIGTIVALVFLRDEIIGIDGKAGSSVGSN